MKNRVHLDLATNSAAHQAETVARLKELGSLIEASQQALPEDVAAMITLSRTRSG